MQSIQNAIKSGLGFLAENQISTGEFPSFMALDPEMKVMCVPESSIFPTALILHSLEFVSISSHEMVTKACQFLVDEMTPPGLWRYWTERPGGDDVTRQIALDLDVTCCAALVLRRLRPEVSISGNIGIILGNMDEKGLFFTWIKDRKAGNDVDSVVNANVLCYLGERPGTQRVIDYLNEIVQINREADSYFYYLDDLALYYMMSRAFFHGVSSLKASRQLVGARVLKRLAEARIHEDPLLASLAFCTLLNYSFRPDHILQQALNSLMCTQQSDGGWPLTAFYAGPEFPVSHSVWFGSRALTTGFCLEALARYSR
jgi:hypothetical protein